jgi:hypothetical protein
MSMNRRRARHGTTLVSILDVAYKIPSVIAEQFEGRLDLARRNFSTNGCYNCVNNYPHNKAWQERYSGEDMVIVGIHTPETPGERDVARIKAQAAKHGLKFPIAVDNDGSNWKVWNNRCWPTVYVVDRPGIVRYGWEGELSYKGAAGEETVRRLVDALLRERP